MPRPAPRAVCSISAADSLPLHPHELGPGEGSQLADNQSGEDSDSDERLPEQRLKMFLLLRECAFFGQQCWRVPTASPPGNDRIASPQRSELLLTSS